MPGYSYSTLVLRQTPKETEHKRQARQTEDSRYNPARRFPYSTVLLTLAMSVSQAAEGEEAFTLVGSVK